MTDGTNESEARTEEPVSEEPGIGESGIGESEPKTAGADDAGAASSGRTPHGDTVRMLASAMLRSAVWPASAVVLIGGVVAAFFVGVPGFAGAVVGGAVAFASSLVTLWLMRWTADYPPMFVMVAALSGYLGKMIVLLVVMTLLRDVEMLHAMSLAVVMLATILVWTGAEVRGFRKVKVPTIVPGS